MALYLLNGTRVTKAGVSVTADPDPIVTVNNDLYRRRPLPHEVPTITEGSLFGLWVAAGTKMRRSELDRMFADAQIDSITPATGGTAGGTPVTLRGRDLIGVTSVTFGGTAGTALTVVSPGVVTVVTPAKSAGAVAVAVVNDAGTTTVANGFTYA